MRRTGTTSPCQPRETAGGPAIRGQAKDGGTGVKGVTTGTTGIGVWGQTPGTGSAVYGEATGTGVGVFGDTTNGTGVIARSTNGTALNVNGKAHFSRSGKRTIPAGASSAVVTLAGVTATSMVQATLQKHAAGFTVESAVPAAGSFRIWLNKPAPTGGLPVAWIVLD